MRLLAWRPVRKRSLRGFADVELEMGLQLRRIAVFQQRSSSWASFPRLPEMRDGRQLRDDWGNPAWLTLLAWRDRGLDDQFSRQVVELVRAAHPQDFDAEEADAGEVKG